MTDAATILAWNGNQDPRSTITAAALEHIELALAAAMLEKESNGRNVWGHDPGSTGGAYVKGAPVTRSAYLAYRDLVHAGKIGRQGVGPAQCTSAGYQDTADALGGCWDPVANMRSGFRGLGALVARYGVQGGAQRYNGSGPAAVAYGKAFAARYAIWRTRLADAAPIPTPPVSEDDELNADQAKQLDEIHAQAVRAEPPWAGGYTDTANSPYDGYMYGKRANVEIHQAWLAIQALSAKVDALAASLAVKP